MPNYKEIEKILLEKLGNNNDSQVIVIKGKWGTGKTYLWNDIKAKLRGDDTSINNKCIWVSLCEELKKILKSTINFVISAFVLLLCLENICKCFKNRNNSVKTADAALSDKENQKEDNPKKDSDKSIKTAYVSLFSKENLDEINKSALQSFYFMNKAESKFNKMKHWLGSFTTAMGENTKLSMALQGIDGLLTILKKDDLKNAVICFDDLERMNDNIPLKDFFGYVNELAEHNKCNVVLIMNDDVFFGKDKKNDSKSAPGTTSTKQQDDTEDNNAPPDTNSIYSLREEQYSSFKEKVIDFELNYEPTPEENFKIAYENIEPELNDKISNSLKNVADLVNETNIRVLMKSLHVIREITSIIETNTKLNNDEAKIQFYGQCFVCSALYWKYNLPSIDGSIFLSSSDNSPIPTNVIQAHQYLLASKLDGGKIKELYKYIFDVLSNGKEFSIYGNSLVDIMSYHNIYKNYKHLNEDVKALRNNFMFDYKMTKTDYIKLYLDILGKKEYEENIFDHLTSDNGNHPFEDKYLNDDNLNKELIPLARKSAEAYISDNLDYKTKVAPNTIKNTIKERLDIIVKTYPELGNLLPQKKITSIDDVNDILVSHDKFLPQDDLRLLDSLSDTFIYDALKTNPAFFNNSVIFLIKYRDLNGLQQGESFRKNIIDALNKLRKENGDMDLKFKMYWVNYGYDFIELLDNYKDQMPKP